MEFVSTTAEGYRMHDKETTWEYIRSIWSDSVMVKGIDRDPNLHFTHFSVVEYLQSRRHTSYEDHKEGE